MRADRHDVSPALRSIPPAPPTPGHEREAPRLDQVRRRGAGRGRVRALDPVLQNFSPASTAPITAQSIDGVSNVNGVLPPDTNGAVGPNHYVQWVNVSFAVFSKGSESTPPAMIYGPATGNTIWSGFGGPCETTNDGDPVVLYDHLADRWVMSQLAIPNAFFGIVQGPFYQCIAISTTPDPTGSYYRYQFSFTKLNDYPKFAVWPDAYYMTMNQFEAITLKWAGQGVIAFDREKMLAGENAGLVYFDLSSVDLNLGGMLPADLDGPPPPTGSPAYFMQVDDDAWGYAPDQLQLWRFHVDWTNPSSSSFTGPSLLPVAAFDSALCGGADACIPQPNSTATLDTLSDRLMYRLAYRNLGSNESLVVNHSVDVDGTDHAGLRWYEVRNPASSPFIYQQGTYAPDANHRWMGSIAMDAAGNMALGYSVSSSTVSPSVRLTGRLSGDALGTMTQSETEVATGAGSQTNTTGRWGDYSRMAVDPVDDCTFWYTQQYYAATSDSGWRTRIAKFSFPSCQASTAPAVSIAASTPKAFEAGQIPGAFTVSRAGDLSAAITVSYIVSGSATPGSDYVALPGTVTIPAGAASVTVPVMPIDDNIAEDNESVFVTLRQDPSYRTGIPSEAFVTIVSDDAPPDLIVSAATAPALSGAGNQITVSDTTTNQGAGNAAPSTTGFYLSTDFTLNAADVFLGSRAVAALSPGQSDAASTTLTIPAGTTTGTYFVLAKANFNGAVSETQPGNNVKASGGIRVGPDLAITVLTAPATASAGAAMTVSDTIVNQGGGGAAGTTTQYYLSTNTLIDSADILLGTRTVPPLAALASDSATVSLTIPAGTAAGAYFVVAKADGTSAVTETSEFNNTRASTQLKIGADLVVSALTVPLQSGAGATIVVSDTTQNLGTSDAAPSATGFYLSANAVFDATDMLIGRRTVAGLAPNESNSGTTSLQIPAGTATGSYFIIAAADVNATIGESVETNNTRVASLRVGPDLTVSALVTPPTAGAGATISVSDTTVNQGGGSAADSATGFYLSTNVTIDSSDVLLGTRAVPTLAAGASNSGTTTLTIPAGTPTGTYFIIGTADANGSVVETLESNNAKFSLGVRIGPDLVVTALTAPASAVAESSFTVTDTTANQGGGSAPTSTTQYYLSVNAGFDASDILIGSRAVTALASGGSSAGSATVQVPAGTPAGNYFLFAVADGPQAIPETFDTNNTRSVLIKITHP